MKKALVIFLALALVGSVFAAEPAAEVKVAEFTGDASLTFGIDLNEKTDKGDYTVKTGFKNETSASLKLNLLNGGDKATEGDGIWGELVISTKGAAVESGDPAKLALTAAVDKAVLHFGPVYMGITSDKLEYGGDFWYPNALNYMDKDDGLLVRKPADSLGYDQGFVLGYKHKDDLFKVEASVRTKKDTTKMNSLEEVQDTDISEKGKKYYGLTIDGNFVEKVGDGKKTVAVLFEDEFVVNFFFVTKKAGEKNFWTNKYALGLSGELKPIKDLRIGLGFAYALGDLTKDAGTQEGDVKKLTQNANNAGDMTMFAGVDYRFAINEAFFLQPTLTYTMYVDKVWKPYADSAEYKKDSDKASNVLNTGLRFGFGKSKSSSGSSLLYGFFENNSLYTDRNAVKDNGDGMLLPGVSFVASFDMKKDAMKKNLPIMATFYSGEIVKGLNAVALFGANVAKDASTVGAKQQWKDDTGAGIPGTDGYAPAASEKLYEGIIGERGVQAGVAASYDIMVGDLTIVPSAGMLWTYGSQNGKEGTTVKAHEFKVEANVDVKGLIKNTTLSLFWDGAAYGKASSPKIDSGITQGVVQSFFAEEHTFEHVKPGIIGIKAKISF